MAGEGKGTKIIVPMLLEPNGNVSSFLKLAKNPEVKKEYTKLVKRLNADPKNVSKKLREVTWGRKTLDDIFEELQ